MASEEFFGFVERATGRPVGLLVTPDASDYGESVVLARADEANRPFYRADSADDLKRVLEGTSFYNESERFPGMGMLLPDDLMPATIRVSLSFEEVDLARATTPSFRVDEKRRVPRAVVAQWAPEVAGLLPERTSFLLVTGEMDDPAVEPLSVVGKNVALGSGVLGYKHGVLAALPVSERLADMVSGPDVKVVLICTLSERDVVRNTAELVEACRGAWERAPAPASPGGP